jgi:hypothetical protein
VAYVRPQAGGRVSAESGNQAIADQATGAMVGFICLGPEARVPGVEAQPGILDVGAGMRPDLVGTHSCAQDGREVSYVVLMNGGKAAG